MNIRKLASILCLLLLGSALSCADQLLIGNYFANNIGRLEIPFVSPLSSLSNVAQKGTLCVVPRPDGKIYVCSEQTNQILRYDLYTGHFVDVFCSQGLNNPTAITFDSGGNAYVANFVSNTVTKYNAAGTFLGTFVSANSGGLSGPDVGTTFGPDGNLYVPSFNNNRILRYNGQTGAYMNDFVAAGYGGLSQPRMIVWRPDGYVYVTSDDASKVIRYRATDGVYVDTFIASGTAGLDGVVGMVFDRQGYLYLSSWRNNKIVRFSAATGAYVDTPLDQGTGSTYGPTFLALLVEPDLSGISMPTQIVGGASVPLYIGLYGKAVLDRATVSLTTSNSLLTAPATATVKGGSNYVYAIVNSSPVSATTISSITATYQGTVKSLTITLTPGLKSFYLASSSVVGGQSVTGTVVLRGAAPKGGTPVNMTSSSSAATVPASVTVTGVAVNLTVHTSAVAATTNVVLSASLAGTTVHATLSVSPPVSFASLTFNPPSVQGGQSSTGTLTLNAAAPPGGITVSLSSSTPSANPGSSVAINAGQTSAKFVVTTTAVASSSVAQITAAYGGASKSASLTLTH